MQRHREVAAAPCRSASDTWSVITTLFADTLARSPAITRAEVETTMSSAAGVGRMLVAGGHLRDVPLVLVASPIHLSITTVDGGPALTLEENLAPVPGGSSATDWTVHLPSPEPHQDDIARVAAGNPNLSADPAPADADQQSAAASTRQGGVLDLSALQQRDPSR